MDTDKQRLPNGEPLSIYDQKVWRKGCNYIVAAPGDLCTKCGKYHNQTAFEAEVGLFHKTETKDEPV